MILTCPNCTTRFVLSAFALAPDGRKVKCSNCAETWFQLPDPEELKEQADKKPEDIPDSVKPIPEGSSVPAIKDDDKEKKKSGVIGGILAALFVFIIIAAALIIMHKSVIEVAPSTLPIYKSLGIVENIPGEGLVFDRMTAAQQMQDGQSQIFLSGSIINLTSENTAVPMMLAELRDPEGNVLDSILVAPPQKTLEAEQTLPFEALIHDDVGASEIIVKFTLSGGNEIVPELPEGEATDHNETDHGIRIDEVDGGNIPVPHEDDTARPNAHEESLESPPPASSEPHQESLH